MTNLGHKVVMAVCRDLFNKGYQLYRNIFLQVFIWLEHGSTIVGTTRHNRIGFPKDIVNKGAVDRCTRGMSVSTIIDDKIHCFAWLDNKSVFSIDSFWVSFLYYSSKGADRWITCRNLMSACS